MKYASLNIDEVIYQIHLVLWGWVIAPLWYILSFRWLFDFLDFTGISKIFGNKPSIERDTIYEALNPRGERSFFDYLLDIFFGAGDQQSIISVLFGSIFGLLLIGAIIAYLISKYFKNQLSFISEKEKIIYDLAYTNHEKQEANDKAIRWQKILDNVNSDNQNNWKVAILDADILLSDVLGEQGYFGETVADKLKDAQGSGLSTLQSAWEAHKVRNTVAHTAEYVISQHEARRAISLYEQFFNEFYHAT